VIDAFIGAAALPVGPSLDQRRDRQAAPIVLVDTKGVPTRWRGKNTLQSARKQKLLSV
jgi:hypothetical protein